MKYFHWYIVQCSHNMNCAIYCANELHNLLCLDMKARQCYARTTLCFTIADWILATVKSPRVKNYSFILVERQLPDASRWEYEVPVLSRWAEWPPCASPAVESPACRFCIWIKQNKIKNGCLDQLRISYLSVETEVGKVWLQSCMRSSPCYFLHLTALIQLPVSCYASHAEGKRRIELN